MLEKQIDNMDLLQIANSGQCFRWKKIEEDTYRITAFNKVLEISQSGSHFFMNASENDWNDIWKAYFDIDTDYSMVGEKILSSDDKYLIECYKSGSGVRILKQDIWEMIISYLISQNNNIPRIKSSIEKLCISFGDNLDSDFGFPSFDKIDVNAISGKEFGLGYRDAYIKAMCEYTSNNINWYDKLKALNYDEAYMTLKAHLGIGPKVANCICLFGLHHVDAFPIDTHVKQILAKYYPDGFDFERYNGVAGIVQQYMFYNKIENR